MFKSLLFLFTFFLLLNFSSRASHVAGAEMTYRCIGNGSYEITLVFYRDCFGISTPTQLSCVIDNTCNFPSQNFTLYQVSTPPITVISSACPGEFTTCDYPPGNIPGIQKYIYKGTVLLGAFCSQWSFNISFSGRSGWITTLKDPDYNNLFINTTLNNIDSVSPCNNSPEFINDPFFFVCKDQQTCIDPGIFDAEGDSLACFMTAPLTNENSPIAYMPGFSIAQPLSTNSPVTIDNATGVICFTPVQQEISTIVLLVNEYRNGIQIGQVKRDVIIYVTNCTGHVPELSGFSGDTSYNITLCAGIQNCLPVYSDDADALDTTTLTWDHNIPSAAFYTSGGQHDAGLFCWTPGLADVSSTPYCFNATVRDNDCHGSRSRVYQYCVTVVLTDSVCLYINSTNNLNVENGLKIYPQPASDHLFIDFGNDLAPQNIYQLRIGNILGETVFQTLINGQITSIDLVNLSTSGMYIATVHDENGNVIKKKRVIVSR